MEEITKINEIDEIDTADGGEDSSVSVFCAFAAGAAGGLFAHALVGVVRRAAAGVAALWAGRKDRRNKNVVEVDVVDAEIENDNSEDDQNK